MSSEPRILKITCPGCQQKLDLSGLPAFARVPCPNCQGSIIVPRPFGDVLLEEPVGHGSIATVYRALDLTLDREVAVKILDVELSRDAERVGRFLQAARRVALVNHPKVVPTYSCGEFDGQPYVVMQYMAGQSLARHTAAGASAPPVADCLRYVEEAAAGLGAAWRQGILHGDVKPSDILLDSDGNVKLGDFGLTPVAVAAASSPYASPERRAVGRQDHRGDIYGLGAVLYHLVTGRPPVEARGGDVAAGVGVAAGAPVPPAEFRADLPAGVNRFVLALLDPLPENRPQSYDEVAREAARLRADVLRGRPAGLEARRRPLAGREADVAAAEEHARASARLLASAGRGSRRRPHPASFWLNLALFAAVAGLVLVVGQARRRGAPWYRGYVEPWTAPVLRQGEGTAGAGRPGSAVAPAGAGVEVGAAESGRGASSGAALATAPGAGDVEPSPSTAGGTAAGTPAPGRSGDAGAPAVPAAQTMSRAELPPVDVRSRPRPKGLDFASVKGPLQEYLGHVPKGAAAVERDRIQLVSTSREYLISLFRFVPYDDAARGVQLQDGRVLRGTVPFCNDREIVVRPSEAAAALAHVAWSDVATEQFAAFFEYYIALRLSRADTLGSGSSEATRRADAANDALRVAVLCDWYGLAESASRFAAKAVELSPALQARADLLIPTVAAAER